MSKSIGKPCELAYDRSNSTVARCPEEHAFSKACCIDPLLGFSRDKIKFINGILSDNPRCIQNTGS
jgi:hypothetical protein